LDQIARNASGKVTLQELTSYFLRLGFMGFGGPVALVGQMERELVGERKWLSREEMREAVAVCQSLPGPLAIQVGIFISYLRGGFWGGWAFILPNFLIVAALGALFVHFGELKGVTSIFYGVSPAVIALILHSSYRLTKLGMEDWLQWLIAAACFVVIIALEAEVALLFIAAGVIGVLYYGSLFKGTKTPTLLSVAPAGAAPLLAAAPPTAATSSILTKLLLFFLKAGAFTFGSGLVIVPFLQQGLVTEYGWLGEREFLIAVAVGMISPGPVVITATFVGYLVAGFWGSLASTVGADRAVSRQRRKSTLIISQDWGFARSQPAHFLRQRTRHRALPSAGPCDGIWLARRAGEELSCQRWSASPRANGRSRAPRRSARVVNLRTSARQLPAPVTDRLDDLADCVGVAPCESRGRCSCWWCASRSARAWRAEPAPVSVRHR
jgi:chromate transporter